MRQRIQALIALVLTAVAVGSGTYATLARAIANGQDAPDGRYGFAVKLTMTDLPDADGGRRDSSCSGSLIAPRWIITARHCFKTAAGTRISRPVAHRTTATVGRTNLTTTSVGHDATVTAVRQSSTTDVALAELDTPITDVEPIRLGRQKPDVGEVVRLAADGLTTDDDESSLATRLQTGQFEVVSLARSYIGMTGRAPRSDTSPCSHDSGGPYFTQQGDGAAVLIAVVSNGPDCPHDEVDLGGRVDTITDWITGIIEAPAAGRPSASHSGEPADRSPAAAPFWKYSASSV